MAKQSYQSRAWAGAWYCVLLNSSVPDNNPGTGQTWLSRSDNAWLVEREGVWFPQKEPGGRQVRGDLARSLSSQYQPSLTRQMAESFVFLLSPVFWLEPASQAARRNVLKTLNTIRKNLSWKLTHSNCPVINTFSASQNWREHNFVQTLTCFFCW